MFTFDGLRRMMGAHPETLSRSLGRLEEDGVVVRSPDGYTATQKMNGSLPLSQVYGDARKVPILHTFLPDKMSAGLIMTSLKGKWFDNMRWVGMTDGEEGFTMKWITDDGSVLIDARFSENQLDVDAKIAREADLPKAVRAAHQLMGRISRLYASPRPGAKLALKRIGYFTSLAM